MPDDTGAVTPEGSAGTGTEGIQFADEGLFEAGSEAQMALIPDASGTLKEVSVEEAQKMVSRQSDYSRNMDAVKKDRQALSEEQSRFEGWKNAKEFYQKNPEAYKRLNQVMSDEMATHQTAGVDDTLKKELTELRETQKTLANFMADQLIQESRSKIETVQGKPLSDDEMLEVVNVWRDHKFQTPEEAYHFRNYLKSQANAKQDKAPPTAGRSVPRPPKAALDPKEIKEKRMSLEQVHAQLQKRGAL